MLNSRNVRVLITGAAGSGTSTLGHALAERLSLPHLDSDDYFHGPSDPPFQNPRPAALRNQMLCQDAADDSCWVLSGGVSEWSPCPELNYSAIVFLYVPTEVRIQRLRQRERQKYGVRVESGGDMYAGHQAFLAWAAQYDVGGVEGRTLQRHETWLRQQICPVLQFRQEMGVAEMVAQIETWLRQ